MAQRRMFSLQIVDTDAFLEMPVSSQLLYFHLAMRADDDGFVSNPKKIVRSIGVNDDDMKVLLAKRFVLSFESGVVVIKHWKIHNYIQNDRYHETKYIEEKNGLITKDNGAYTECIQNTSRMETEARLGKARLELGKVSKSSDKSQDKKSQFSLEGAEVIKAFEVVDPKNKTYYANKTQRSACDFLISEYGLQDVLNLIAVLPQVNQQKLLYMAQITTPYELKENWVKLKNKIGQNIKSKTNVVFSN